MKWPLVFLVLFSVATACVVEDKPVATGGTSGSGGTAGAGGGPIDECGGCTGDTPVCDTSDLTCVECLPDEDDACDDTAPVCVNRVCVCEADSDCRAPDLAVCNTTTQKCVPCMNDADCTDIRGLPNDTNICLDNGTCVDCTPDEEATTCEDNVSCNPQTNECTETEVGSLGVCAECVADSECGDVTQQPSEEHRCVPMFYPSEPNRFPSEESGFCLKTTDSGCEQPFSITLSERPSLSDPAQDDYCGINESLATCPAVLDLLGNVRCDSGQDEECTQPSGICRSVGTLSNRCTYLCSSVVECLRAIPDGRPGSTCGPGDSELEDYCGG